MKRAWLITILIVLGASVTRGASLAVEPSETVQFSSQTALNWTFETVDEGIKPALALDGNDIPHLAYLQEDIMGGTFYATKADNEWVIGDVAQGYFYGPVDIAVSGDGQPFISYHDHQDEGFDPAKGDEVVAILEDGAWNLITVADQGHDGWDNSIVIDSEGFWHTASIDPSQFGSQDSVEYATNAFGDVVVEKVGSGPTPYEFATSIDIRADGIVGVAYFNEAETTLYYAERTAGADGTWTVEAVDGDGDTGRYASMTFDSGGNPHITYIRLDGGSNGTVRYAWRDADGNWQTEDIDALDSIVTGHTGARKITSLDLDSDDGAHVIYSDTVTIRYAERVDGEWQVQTVTEANGSTFGQLVEFTLDSNGLPHLVFFEVINPNPLSGTIIYAHAAAP
jgi:hypothetical protein